MEHKFKNVSGSLLSKTFYAITPCKCFYKKGIPWSKHKYKVIVRYSATTCEQRGHLIKEISTTCNVCGTHKIFDNLESLQIYENDICWNDK